uniref:Secreted protein n=1 Tax=Globodera rostochiensis TaxID=31243 RepID=A0A914HP47_GLORO
MDTFLFLAPSPNLDSIQKTIILLVDGVPWWTVCRAVVDGVPYPGGRCAVPWWTACRALVDGVPCCGGRCAVPWWTVCRAANFV